jgi:hypothetical protein
MYENIRRLYHLWERTMGKCVYGYENIKWDPKYDIEFHHA